MRSFQSRVDAETVVHWDAEARRLSRKPQIESDRWLQREPYRNHGLGASSHIHAAGPTPLGLVSELSDTLQDEERTVRLVAR